MQETLARREKEFLDRVNEKYARFSKSADYHLFEQFVKRYPVRESESDRSNLQRLLKTKKWWFSDEELMVLLVLGRKIQSVVAARDKILLNDPHSEQEIIESYLNFYQSDDEDALIALKDVLEENEYFNGSVIELKKRVKKVQEQIEIQHFEKRLLEGNEGISVQDVDKFSGYEFESFLKELYEKMGYQVEQTRLSGDQGADLVVVKFGEKTVIQAKRFTAKVGNSAIQEIMAAISLYKAQKGMVVTNNYFTSAARELGAANNIELIDRDALQQLIEKNW